MQHFVRYYMGMYLRATKRRNKDGTSVVYYQLAESHWDPEKRRSQATVVHNFGRAEHVDPEALRRLADSIRKVVEGGGLTVKPPRSRSSAGAKGIAVEDLELLPPKAYGGLYALDALWRELGVDSVLDQARGSKPGRRSPHALALFAMVANRLLAPSSKLSCYHWLRNHAHFPAGKHLKLSQLYSAMDFLGAHADEIEKKLFWRTADLFSFDVDLVFFDTTTTYFEVDYRRQPKGEDGRPEVSALRKRGHSKDKRPNNPQVIIALAVTRDGIPVRSWVFPGNTVDATTIARVRADLKEWRLTFVGDAGMHSEANKKILASSGGRYLLATPLRKVIEVYSDVLPRAGRFKKINDQLKVKEVVVGEGETRRRYFVCKNESQALREGLHREEILEHLEEELKALAASKDDHPKRACELLSSRRYGKYLRQSKKGRLEIDKAKVRSEERLDGKWVVTTNDDSLSAEDGALGYKAAMMIESCFRRMKTTGLKLRPVFPWTNRRIVTHVQLCVIALLLQRVAELRCDETWRNIREALASIHVVECVTPTGSFTKTTKPSSEALDHLASLGVQPPRKLLTVATASKA